jgi:hypothetical protein
MMRMRFIVMACAVVALATAHGRTPTAEGETPGSFEAAVAAVESTPEAALDLVRDRLAYRPYNGSLKGPVGAWNDRTANAADAADLLIEVLGRKHIRARLAHGQLGNDLVTALLRTCFQPGEYPQTVQEKLPGGEIANPVKDAVLRARVARHVWVQAMWKGTWVDLDPVMPDFKAGQAAAKAVYTQPRTDRGAGRRLRVGVFARTAGAAEPNRLLHVEQPLAPLLGQRIVLLNLGLNEKSRATEPAPRTLHPMLIIGNRGVESQMAYGGAPTGKAGRPGARMGGVFDRLNPRKPPSAGERVEEVFVDIALLGGGLPDRTQRRYLYLAGNRPLNRLQEVTTMCVTFGAPRRAAVQRSAGRALEFGKITRGVTLPASGAVTDEHKKSAAAMVNGAIEVTRALSLWLAATSHHMLSDLDRAFGTISDYDDARVIAVSLDARRNVVATDLIFDSVRSWVRPGAKLSAAKALAGARGRLEADLEGAVLAAVQKEVVGDDARILTVSTVFEAAYDAGGEFVVLLRERKLPLADMPVSAGVRRIVTERIDSGRIVLMPARPVKVAGYDHRVTAWYEIDRDTGQWVGVLDDGRHSAITEYKITKCFAAYISGFAGGYWGGFGTALYNYSGTVLGMINHRTNQNWDYIRSEALKAAADPDWGGNLRASMIAFAQSLSEDGTFVGASAALGTAIGCYEGQDAGYAFLLTRTH